MPTGIQIVIPVDKDAVTVQIKRMHKYLQSANSIGAGSSIKDLQEALRVLCIAKGSYNVLKGFGLLADGITVSDDIDRIENKINGIMEEKYRSKGIVWKH